MNTFKRIAALFISLVMAASFMVACKDEETKEPEAPAENTYDLTGFTIVRADSGAFSITNAVSDLKDAISSKIGLELPITVDSEKEAGDKEILVGETDRMESKATVNQLKKRNTKNSWTIRIASSKIVITGTDTASTLKGIEAFIKNYVAVSASGGALDISAGIEMSRIYDKDSIITAKNGAEIMVEIESVMLPLSKRYEINGEPFTTAGATYPGVTVLQYQQNPENNGKIVAMATASSVVGDTSTAACIIMSADGGKTWNVIARPTQKTFAGISCGTMANIYELPAKVGDLPAGTLIYSHNIVDYNKTNGISVIQLLCSFDAGYTWEEYSMVDEAGGLGEGVWEPFMIYCEEDGYLYCFYSDDSDPAHDQKIVYKRSKDAKKWEGKNGRIGELPTGKDVEPVDVIAMSDSSHRPGMPVITKMGNGKYFMAYEYIDAAGKCVIRYRTTEDLANWGDPNNMGNLIGMWSAPSCAWLNAGGENGLLLVAAKGGSNNGYMMASFDYGKTWERIDDPLSGTPIKTESDRIGYSGFMFVAKDGKTLYYVNAVNDPSNPKNRGTVAFVKMYVYE